MHGFLFKGGGGGAMHLAAQSCCVLKMVVLSTTGLVLLSMRHVPVVAEQEELRRVARLGADPTCQGVDCNPHRQPQELRGRQDACPSPLGPLLCLAHEEGHAVGLIERYADKRVGADVLRGAVRSAGAESRRHALGFPAPIAELGAQTFRSALQCHESLGLGPP